MAKPFSFGKNSDPEVCPLPLDVISDQIGSLEGIRFHCE
jgi:hypothetical protein